MSEEDKLVPLKDFTVQKKVVDAFNEICIAKGLDPKLMTRLMYDQFVANAGEEGERIQAELLRKEAAAKKIKLQSECLAVIKRWMKKHKILSLKNFDNVRQDWKRELYEGVQFEASHNLTIDAAERLVLSVIDSYMPPPVVQPIVQPVVDQAEELENIKQLMEAVPGDNLDKHLSPHHVAKEDKVINGQLQNLEHEQKEEELNKVEKEESGNVERLE